ncbi:hypothetical protein Y1Q_0019789 [Alligator mississippiensis]|uniref:Uncharacterized protein n=1 Tax=Alligator mississippiensis TaxID=8496 RepID=A0A151PFZ3_ALLMI|nr:hypothetical protein Y1Q_0019789 [Alligator mississippiensis]
MPGPVVRGEGVLAAAGGPKGRGRLSLPGRAAARRLCRSWPARWRRGGLGAAAEDVCRFLCRRKGQS